MTISSLLTCTVKISTKTFADVCRRTCGICNDNQLPLPSQPIPPGYPPFPLPLRGKKSNTLFYLKIIDGSNKNRH